MVKIVNNDVTIAKIISATRLEYAKMGANLTVTEPTMQASNFSAVRRLAHKAAKLKNVMLKLENVPMDVKL